MTFETWTFDTWQEILAAPVGGALVFLLLTLGHWIPVGGGRGQLPKTLFGLIGRYTYGTAMVLISFSVAVALLGLPWWLPLVLLFIDICAGLAVLFAYCWDRVHDAIVQSWMARAADDELSGG